MFVFKLPNDTMDQINVRLKKFWWKKQQDKRKMCNIEWKEICKPVNEGGLGVRDIKNNNLALLGKTC